MDGCWEPHFQKQFFEHQTQKHGNLWWKKRLSSYLSKSTETYFKPNGSSLSSFFRSQLLANFICGIDGSNDDDKDDDIHGTGCSQRFCLPTAGNIDPWLTKAAQAGKLHIGCHGTTCDQFWEWKMFWLNVFWGINGVKIWDITHWKQSLCRKESGGA